MRDHGGNIDAAKARYGGTDWIDLSTGINRQPYPLPPLPAAVWTDLPTRSAQDALIRVAQTAFATSAPMIALQGAQAAIQILPHLSQPGHARVLTPTYNEHAAALRSAGWDVSEVATLTALEGADLAVIVNPNNPDGQHHDPEALRALSTRVTRLIVDESFADASPALSVAAHASDRLIVLRSFGKFWGLAGLRLGFALAGPQTIARIADHAGPWPISGAALEIGRLALADRDWQNRIRRRLALEATRLDDMATRAAWQVVGGTHLFRTYATPDAQTAQNHFAQARIWTRIFPYSTGWIRFGLPGSESEWSRLQDAFATLTL